LIFKTLLSATNVQALQFKRYNSGAPVCDDTFYDYPDQWTGGANGNFYIKFPNTVSGWTIRVTFSSPVTQLSVWNGAGIR
jgi:hypothetical protein